MFKVTITSGVKHNAKTKTFKNVMAASEPEAVQWGIKQGEFWGWKSLKVKVEENAAKSK